jgi:hypothetical protein
MQSLVGKISTVELGTTSSIMHAHGDEAKFSSQWLISYDVGQCAVYVMNVEFLF